MSKSAPQMVQLEDLSLADLTFTPVDAFLENSDQESSADLVVTDLLGQTKSRVFHLMVTYGGFTEDDDTYNDLNFYIMDRENKAHFVVLRMHMLKKGGSDVIRLRTEIKRQDQKTLPSGLGRRLYKRVTSFVIPELVTLLEAPIEHRVFYHSDFLLRNGKKYLSQF